MTGNLSIELVAQALLGQPNKREQQGKDKQWRYGSRGSLAVNLTTNTWFDHEANEGGGVDKIFKWVDCAVEVLAGFGGAP